MIKHNLYITVKKENTYVWQIVEDRYTKPILHFFL